MGRAKRTGDERVSVSVRVKTDTLDLFADKAQARGQMSVRTFIADYLDWAAAQSRSID